MNRLAEYLYSIAIALWVGGVWAVGYLVAPILFAQLPDRSLAGNLAGVMFSSIAWVGLAAGAYLALYLVTRRRWSALKSGVFWIVIVMVAMTMAGHFGVQPILMQLKADALPRTVMESALRDRFTAWHGISSGMYLVQSLLGLWLAMWQERGKH